LIVPAVKAAGNLLAGTQEAARNQGIANMMALSGAGAQMGNAAGNLLNITGSSTIPATYFAASSLNG
jgi:hypothetical protein